MSTIGLDNRVFFQNNLSVSKQNKTINVFIIGTGLVGGTLIDQIYKQEKEINICGIANSTNVSINTKGIDLKNWKKELAKSKKTNFTYLISQMIKLGLPNSVFVDCTSSDEIPLKYEKILKAGIPIVTPNKKANSGPYKNYAKLSQLSTFKNVPFVYETNVGGGLPIISTMQNIVTSGDEIIKIEGIFSGTLSYIFNTHSQSDKPISQIIHEARENGYTEPDPREDLNGQDMARKLLIIARVAGYKLELNNIKIGNILPKSVFQMDSVTQFLENLKTFDRKFDKQKIIASKKNKVMRYVATLQNGSAEIKLKAINYKHPLSSLSGCDNIITITTKRYNKNPIVIKGPGAGAEVTAGGILGNIINIFRN